MNRNFSFCVLFGIIFLYNCGGSKEHNLESIEAAPISMYYDETSDIVVVCNPSDAPAPKSYTYVSSDKYVATVSKKGVVSGVHVGECVIEVTSDGGVTTGCEVTIDPRSTLYADPCLEFGCTKAKVKAFEKRTPGYEDAEEIDYKGENKNVEAVAYLFENGKLDMVGVILASTQYCVDESLKFLGERFDYSGLNQELEVEYFNGKGIIAAVGVLEGELFVLYFAGTAGSTKSGNHPGITERIKQYKERGSKMVK